MPMATLKVVGKYYLKMSRDRKRWQFLAQNDCYYNTPTGIQNLGSLPC